MFPAIFMSKREMLSEARKFCTSWRALVLSSAGASLISVATRLMVSSLSHTILTISKTSFITVVEKSLIVNRKFGHVVAKGATRKVIAFEDHTLRWRRKFCWSMEML